VEGSVCGGRGLAKVGVERNAQPPQRLLTMDKAKMLELFGSDSEGSDDEPAPPTASSSRAVAFDGDDDDDDAGDAVGEDDLFGGGSDDSADEEAGRPAEPEVPSAPPLHYELPELSRPPEDAELFLVR